MERGDLSDDSDNYIRMVMLLSEGSKLAAGETLARHVTENFNGDLDECLKKHRTDLENLLTAKDITPKQMVDIYPRDGTKTDLKDWTATMICLLIKTVFGSKLTETEAKSIEEIYEIRRKILDEFKDLKISDNTYQGYWVRLATSIGSLLLGASPEVITQGNKAICELYSGTVNPQTAMSVLESLSNEISDRLERKEPAPKPSSSGEQKGDEDGPPYTREIRMKVKCTSLAGLANIWNKVQGGGVQGSLDELSAALSEQVGSEIKVEAHVDVKSFSEALESAKTALNITDEDLADDKGATGSGSSSTEEKDAKDQTTEEKDASAEKSENGDKNIE